MELRELAHILLDTPTLEAKFFFPSEGLSSLTDHDPGPALPWTTPQRPADLQIAPRKQRKPLPHPTALHDPQLRVRCLHTFANHELMALELMAWALLAYPRAPAAFRRGLAWLIQEEQEHLRLYIERIEAHGARFGEIGVNDHFWRVAHLLETPAQWVCAMNLCFEQANLDHAPLFAHHFREAGDEGSAALMVRIEQDEIRHVGFGVRWLRHFCDEEQLSFESFATHMNAYMDPSRARGDTINVAARLAAGLDEAFIKKLQDYQKVA